MLNEDYKEILQILLNNKTAFLIVDAYAMAAHGYPRATGDFDIWVERSPENAKIIYRSLAEFGAPVSGITENTFTEEKVVFQIGIAPRRVDVVTHIDGVIFEEAYKTKEIIEIEGLKVPFLSKANLIKNKESTPRKKRQNRRRIFKRGKEGLTFHSSEPRQVSFGRAKEGPKELLKQTKEFSDQIECQASIAKNRLAKLANKIA